jgi:hypothetical protein
MSAADRGEPVEAYLDDLVRAMAGRRPRDLRAVLAEAEAHLYDDVEAAVARGVPREQAELEAVARFGPAADIAAAERARRVPTTWATVAQLVRSAVLLGGLGAVAVGVSGLIAEAVRLVGGSRALVGIAAGRQLAGSDCARWLAAYPDAGNCRAAAIADWADETVFYRLALGVAGLLLLGAYRWLRRGDRPSRPLKTARDAVGLTAFGLAAAYTSAAAVDAAGTGSGVGQWLSALPVAAGLAGVFGVLLLRDLGHETD